MLPRQLPEEMTLQKKMRILLMISRDRMKKSELPERAGINKSLCYYYIDKLIKMKLVAEDENGDLVLTNDGELLIANLVEDLQTNGKSCIIMSAVLFCCTIAFFPASTVLAYAFASSSLSFLVAGLMFGSAHRKRLALYGLESNQKF